MKWYKYNIQNLTDDEYAKWYSLMSEEKQKKINKSRILDAKKRTVAGEMLCRKAISEWLGILPESIVFGVTEHGKPYAKNLDIQFNISHSGNMVVCAVNNKPIGIDIEEIVPTNLKLAKRFCSNEELIYLFGHTPKEEDFVYTENKKTLTRFFKLWTAKEAYGKYIGNGLASISVPCSKEVKTTIIENKYCLSTMTQK